MSAKKSAINNSNTGKSIEQIVLETVFLLETKSHNNWGLEYRTLSYGVVHENSYWLLQYRAPRLHYFDTYLPEFFAFKDTLKLKETCFLFCGE